MDNSEIRKEIQEEVRKAEKILVGIGRRVEARG